MDKIIIDNELEEFLLNELSLDKIKDHIIRTSIVAWGSVISKVDIDTWLSNFDGSACGNKDIEQKIACWILLYFTYFTEDDINELCKSLYRKYLRKKLDEIEGSPRFKTLDAKLEYILSNTIFLPMGNPSESGGRILYNFRTQNDLPKECFEKNFSSYENVVLIDDLTITGEQASRYVEEGKIDVQYKNLYFATFFATSDAIKHIAKIKDINFINVCILDDRTKAFHESSFIFSHEKINKIIELAQQICEYYGQTIVNNFTSVDLEYMKSHPLGFGNSQQLIGFEYNTPDNVLPILWGETSNWKNIFKRFTKKTNIEGGEDFNGLYI